MAKSGGMLNAICAKLLKTTNDVTCDKSTADTCDKDDEEAVDADVENNNAPGYKNTTVIKDQHGGRMMIPSPAQDSQQSIDSLMSIETESSIRAKPLSPQESTSPIRNGHSRRASGRRNRRKNMAPRNIAQLHEADDFIEEEIEEFEINNRGIDLVNMPVDEQRGKDVMVEAVRMEGSDDGCLMTALDLSSSVSTSNRDSESLATSASSVQIETLAAEEYTMDVTGALDLSLSKNSKSSDSNNVSFPSSTMSQMMTLETDDSSRDSESADIYVQTADPTKSSALPSGTPAREKAPNSSDANDMKDYAQNTMNELLSLYGLGKQEAESITESVSLENFSSGNILARQLPGTQLNQNQQIQVQAAALAAVAGRVQKKGVTRTKPSAEADAGTSNSSSPVPQSAGEAAYTKFVENISKLSKLPQGKTIPSLTLFLLI